MWIASIVYIDCDYVVTIIIMMFIDDNDKKEQCNNDDIDDGCVLTTHTYLLTLCKHRFRYALGK